MENAVKRCIRTKNFDNKDGKLKFKDKQRTCRTFSKFAHDVTPADCSLDFEGISSPKSPAIMERKIPDL